MRLEVTGGESNLSRIAASGMNPSIGNRNARNGHDSAIRNPHNPSFIICPNHQSFLDPFVLCSNYPYRSFQKHLPRRSKRIF